MSTSRGSLDARLAALDLTVRPDSEETRALRHVMPGTHVVRLEGDPHLGDDTDDRRVSSGYVVVARTESGPIGGFFIGFEEALAFKTSARLMWGCSGAFMQQAVYLSWFNPRTGGDDRYLFHYGDVWTRPKVQPARAALERFAAGYNERSNVWLGRRATPEEVIQAFGD